MNTLNTNFVFFIITIMDGMSGKKTEMLKKLPSVTKTTTFFLSLRKNNSWIFKV